MSEPDPERRAALVAARTAPDIASVNLSEPGAVQVMHALLRAGIGIEAGIWSVEDAQRFGSQRLRRVLVEVMPGSGEPATGTACEIDAAVDRLDVSAPRCTTANERPHGLCCDNR